MHPPKLTVGDLDPAELVEIASVFAAVCRAQARLDAVKINNLLDLVFPRGAKSPRLDVPPETLARVIWPSAPPPRLPTAQEVVDILDGWHLVH